MFTLNLQKKFTALLIYQLIKQVRSKTPPLYFYKTAIDNGGYKVLNFTYDEIFEITVQQNIHIVSCTGNTACSVLYSAVCI